MILLDVVYVSYDAVGLQRRLGCNGQFQLFVTAGVFVLDSWAVVIVQFIESDLNVLVNAVNDLSDPIEKNVERIILENLGFYLCRHEQDIHAPTIVQPC